MDLIGKTFQLPGITSFKVKHAKQETRPSADHVDGSFSPSFTTWKVSNDGNSWYRVYSEPQTQIK